MVTNFNLSEDKRLENKYSDVESAKRLSKLYLISTAVVLFGATLFNINYEHKKDSVLNNSLRIKNDSLTKTLDSKDVLLGAFHNKIDSIQSEFDDLKLLNAKKNENYDLMKQNSIVWKNKSENLTAKLDSVNDLVVHLSNGVDSLESLSSKLLEDNNYLNKQIATYVSKLEQSQEDLKFTVEQKDSLQNYLAFYVAKSLGFKNPNKVKDLDLEIILIPNNKSAYKSLKSLYRLAE